MDLNTIGKLLDDAAKGGYAIPAFNFNDCWDLMAIIEAAEEERSPIFISSVGYVVDSISLELCALMGRLAMKKAKVPVILHLDHSTSTEACKEAVDKGYPSIMIDASMLPLENNVRAVKEVVRYAHARGVFVEAEIGKIKGKEDENTSYHGDDFLAQVTDAKALVEETGVDMLAVGIGTQHGFYKGKPELNFQRLREVDAVVSCPLVLHGGTGIPEEDVKQGIKCGIQKINIGTIIRYTYMNALHDNIEKMGAATTPTALMKETRPEIKRVVKEWIQVCMSDGKI
jgi:ketose-bisphosphate aldolase